METVLAGLIEAWLTHTLLDIAMALAAVLVATSVQVGIGIAFGLIAAPLLALIDIAFVPAPVLFLTFLTAIIASLRERSGVKWDQLRHAIAGRVAGSICGVLVLSMIPGEKAFMLIFGGIIALAVLVSVSGFRIPFTLGSIATAGALSGFSASITSVGGPPMAVVYQRQASGEARPTLQLFFALGAFLTLVILWIGGHIGVRDIALAILLLPGMLLGFFIGPRLRPFFDRRFRQFLLGTAAIAAVMLIMRGLS